ncbi:MAG: aspartate/glutamate racemase family protein [Dinoroseobacter sp.]|nr:aspartate/glutamate racemase family protein [Dinoroseobacter sp.]
MKLLGLLGGMSSASTALYYERLNSGARARLGGLHGANLLIRSVDFAPIAQMQDEGNWPAMGDQLAAEAIALERAGAELVLLATNTMHKLAPQISEALSVPFLHIGDATAEAIRASGYSSPGLMATAFTMEQTFYTDRLRAAGLAPVIPVAEDRRLVHRIIYDELCRGIISETSRIAYVDVAQHLKAAGADCLILGCTEVGMLLSNENAPLQVFDTTHIHCDAALDWALVPAQVPA